MTTERQTKNRNTWKTLSGTRWTVHEISQTHRRFAHDAFQHCRAVHCHESQKHWTRVPYASGEPVEEPWQRHHPNVSVAALFLVIVFCVFMSHHTSQFTCPIVTKKKTLAAARGNLLLWRLRVVLVCFRVNQNTSHRWAAASSERIRDGERSTLSFVEGDREIAIHRSIRPFALGCNWRTNRQHAAKPTVQDRSNRRRRSFATFTATIKTTLLQSTCRSLSGSQMTKYITLLWLRFSPGLDIIVHYFTVAENLFGLPLIITLLFASCDDDDHFRTTIKKGNRERERAQDAHGMHIHVDCNRNIRMCTHNVDAVSVSFPRPCLLYLVSFFCVFLCYSF